MEAWEAGPAQETGDSKGAKELKSEWGATAHEPQGVD